MGADGIYPSKTLRCGLIFGDAVLQEILCLFLAAHRAESQYWCVSWRCATNGHYATLISSNTMAESCHLERDYKSVDSGREMRTSDVKGRSLMVRYCEF